MQYTLKSLLYTYTFSHFWQLVWFDISDRNSDGQTKRDTMLPKGCGLAAIIQIIQPPLEIKCIEMTDAFRKET